jgi:hypothetical protein
VIDAFLNTRGPGAPGGWGSMFGTMGVTIDKRRADRIVERAIVFR